MKKKISRFHYLTQDLPAISHQMLAEDACKAGIDWLQLRMKQVTDTLACKKKALDVQAICARYNMTFIVNDDVYLAAEIGADGVHLGKKDMSPKEARKILGENAIIGGTANGFDDIVRLVDMGVDYIGLGPFRFTSTKENLSPVLGEKGYEIILKNLQNQHIVIPIIGIGGIKLSDVAIFQKMNIHGIAVSSAINLASDRVGEARKFWAHYT